LIEQEASSEASTPTGNQTSSSKTNPVAKSAADNAFAQGNLATAPTASTSTAPSGTLFLTSSRYSDLTPVVDYVSSLAYTNTVRSAVSAPALTWSTSLATGAQTYADNCVFAHSGGAYGENIAMGADILAGTKMWGAEKSDWPGGIFTGDTTAGHYTQMIWSNTKQVGCGFSTKCKVNLEYSKQLASVMLTSFSSC